MANYFTRLQLMKYFVKYLAIYLTLIQVTSMYPTTNHQNQLCKLWWW